MASYAETFERVVTGEYAEASDEVKLEAVREVIQIASIAAAAVTIQPIPVIDMALIAPIQIGMVQAIGRVHGYSLDKKSVVEILSSFGAGLVTQGVLLSTAKLIPIVGWLASIPMAYALTWSVGEVAHYYFKMGRGVSPDELEAMFKKVYRSKRAEKARDAKAGSLKARLEDLTEAFKAGLITETEFEKRKQESSVLFEGPSEVDAVRSRAGESTMNVAVAIGAILVVVGFFLGWVGFDLGPATFSVSGWQLAKLAKMHGAHYYLVYLVPIGAAFAGLIALVDKRAGAKLGLVVGGGFLLWSSIEVARFLWRTTFIGLWVTVLGALVLLIAGFATKKSPSWE